MRKIKFELNIQNDRFSVIESNHMYSLHLPNKSHPNFSNKKKFNAWVIESEKMFTDIIYELNDMYIHIYSEYRCLFYNLADFEVIQFENLFDILKSAMQKCFTVSTFGSNGLYYIDKNTKTIIQTLYSAMKLLDETHIKLRNHQHLHKTKIYRERLAGHKRKLKLWGWDHTPPYTRFKEINISKYEHEFFKSYPII